MAYPDVVSRRLERLIERLAGREINVTTDPKLGDPPLGFDNQGLAELRSRINGSDGFGDELAAAVTAGDMSSSMRFGALVGRIVQKSAPEAVTKYEARRREQVRASLVQALVAASPTPVAPADIQLADPIAKYLPLAPVAPGAVDALRDRLNAEHRKYLLSDIRSVDLDGSVLRAIELTIARMLA